MAGAVRTPLALSILTLLYERPMHPYEMRQLMRERGHDQVIKLKGGSLYSTIDRLTAAGLIRPLETSRQGRRPERTVYTLTDAGRDEHRLWLRELLADPVAEYPWFAAALAFLGAVPPDEAGDLLRQRAALLDARIVSDERLLATMTTEFGLPRLFGVEAEYVLAMRQAELAWVRQIVDDIRSGELAWPSEALQLQETRSQQTDEEEP
jgi:DNA-binding PadR family transcriptional regulator